MPDSRAPADFDAHRMDALAYLAGGVSHDLANPLSAMLAFASFLEHDPRLPADLRDDARLLRAEADKTHRMVRALLEFARNRPPALTAVSVDIVLAEILELEDYLLAAVDVERAIDPDLPAVEADPSRLRHLLMVLSVEVLQRLGAKPLEGRLRVAAATHGSGTARRVTVSWAFERPSGREAVVGGAIPAAEALAASLGATIRVREGASGGEIAVELPVDAARPQAEGEDGAADGAELPGTTLRATAVPAATSAASASASGSASALASLGGDAGTPTVLVCDDEDAIRTLLVRVLERAGFRVVPAATPREALDVLASDAVDVVLTDHHMREMTGIELFEAATESRPHLRSRFVLMSGEPGADDLVAFAEERGLLILGKPFDMHSVAGMIREVAAT